MTTTMTVKNCTRCNRLNASIISARQGLILLVHRRERTQVPAKQRVIDSKIAAAKEAISLQRELLEDHQYGECA